MMGDLPSTGGDGRDDQPTRWQRLISAATRIVRWADGRVPRGVRSLLGLLLVVAGVFGLLPVLGFWMSPLAVALIALDIPSLRRRLLAWLEEHSTRPPP
jgi:hypothetical protein